MANPPAPPPVACVIPDLPALTTPTDTCTAALEANGGLPGPTGCPAVPVMTHSGGEPCWRRKVAEAGVLYVAPTSTIRTVAYNKHLKQVWDFYQKHQAKRNNAEQWQACTARRSVVEVEMSKHKLVYPPADNSRHLTGRAFDDGSVDFKLAMGHNPSKMLSRATVTPDSPACTLIWGGSWPKPDNVHFELTGP